MSNKSLYTQFCKDNNQVPVFQQPWWLDVVCPAWDVAMYKKGDNYVGAWPYPIEKKLGVMLLRTPMLTPYMGPVVIIPEDLKESNIDSYEHEAIAAMIAELPKAPVWNLAVQPGVKQAGIFKKYKLHPLVQQTFILELNEDEATLLANMKDAVRRNIKIGESEATITNDPSCLKELYKYQKETLRKKGKSAPMSFDYMQRIMNACLANNSGALWVARDAKNVIQAMVWQVWDKNTSYYFMGAQNPGTNSYRAMSMLLWHTMKQARQQGNKYFDLEGSMDEGVERFFRSFGGDRALYIILKKNSSIVWKLKEMIWK